VYPATDLTLTASWQEKSSEWYSVVYIGNGNTGGIAPVDSAWYSAGSGVTVLGHGSLVKDGYVFLGWSENQYATVVSFMVGSTLFIYDDVTLFAVWSHDVAAVYTVSYEPGLHGTFVARVTTGLSYGDPTPDAPIVTGETGYTFTGWSPLPTATVTGNANYVAQWTQESPIVTPTPIPTATPTLTPSPTASIQPTPDSSPTSTPSPTVNPEKPNPKSEWAVANLVLSIVGAVFAVVLLVLVGIRAFLSKRQDEKGSQGSISRSSKKRVHHGIVWLIVSLILGVMGVMLFLLTEDMSLMRTIVDKWTIVNAVIFIAEVIAISLTVNQVIKRKGTRSSTKYPK
jgi:uncharacterized repeat protein (TIGR02543 family)